ncbi:NUDIX hydrolase [Rathayibacter sp. AY1A3]|uniref:NUDIX domain-containing protein n=1 Tax=Rathayibacter sp. AY1A3 TaxID=2080521 RepID=UPI00215808F6|nr:NUDIX hydrolase [Rathayibacter sp. AY1A3]
MRDSSRESGPLPRGGPDSRADGDPAGEGPEVEEPLRAAPADVAVRQLSTRVAYETPWIRVREDEVLWPGGTRGVYSVVERDDYALVLPRERGGFWLVEQYRYPIGRRAWEFPAGGWPHGSAGGDPEALARAELREETGLRAERLTHLGRLAEAYGFVAQSVDVFLAEGLEHGEHEREDTEQDMRQQWFPDAEIAEMVRSGAIVETAAVAALALFHLERGSLG